MVPTGTLMFSPNASFVSSSTPVSNCIMARNPRRIPALTLSPHTAALCPPFVQSKLIQTETRSVDLDHQSSSAFRDEPVRCSLSLFVCTPNLGALWLITQHMPTARTDHQPIHSPSTTITAINTKVRRPQSTMIRGMESRCNVAFNGWTWAE